MLSLLIGSKLMQDSATLWIKVDPVYATNILGDSPTRLCRESPTEYWQYSIEMNEEKSSLELLAAYIKSKLDLLKPLRKNYRTGVNLTLIEDFIGDRYYFNSEEMAVFSELNVEIAITRKSCPAANQ